MIVVGEEGWSGGAAAAAAAAAAVAVGLAKPCDSCRASPARVFCRADSAFLCLGCDAEIHGANKLASRHERVWICEVCEQAPASVTCKADAASLCVTCDSDIHSANPLSRRHERFPVVPFYDPPPLPSSLATPKSTLFKVSNINNTYNDDDDDDDDDDKVPDLHNNKNNDFNAREIIDNDEEEEEAEAANSWLMCSNNNNNNNSNIKCGDYFFSDVDPYLDLDYGSFHHHHHQNSAAADSVVPVQSKPLPPTPILHPSSNENCFDFDFSRPKPSFSYSQSVSSSSLDVGVVPDSNMSADVSNPFGSTLKSSIGSDLRTVAIVGNSTQATQLSSLDREARVLRYREKRKNRKFEKTIRYASRKAYAETRPRIKGRFAKRTEIESDVDRIFPTGVPMMTDTAGYGVVPSF